MNARRIIPCLDVKDGRVVKGVRFQGHTDMGDAADLAARYRDEGADELVFYDITASPEGRTLDYGWVRSIARLLDIPFSVAGGIRSVDQAARCLDNGADKVSINSPALERPGLIADMADRLGSQCVVVGVDSKRSGDDWTVHQYTGDPDASRGAVAEPLDWVLEAQALGAGEIVLNCMDEDGVRRGYDVAQLAAVRSHLTIPLVASGGAGAASHFLEVFDGANVSGALAASVFHTGALSIGDLKAYLAGAGVEGEAMTTINPSTLNFGKGGGLIPVVVQDAATLQVLTLAYMDQAALEETIVSGEATFFSRSRGGRWRKGETSGDRLFVVSITPDCDADALVLKVRPVGNACHLNRISCFGEEDAPGLGRIARLEATIAERATVDPAESWTARLLAQGPKRAAQKVGEEGVETALAGAAGPDEEVASEAADLIYHLLVLLRARNMVFQDVLDILARRAQPATDGVDPTPRK